MDLPFQPSMKALLLLSALAVCSLAQRFKVPVANKSAYIGQIDGAKGFASFLGIRYAQAPTENLRWKPPVPVSNSTPGDVEASAYGSACIATAISGDIPKEQAEDCLFLNVFLPFPQSTKILPVLVYFHGGGFQSGSARDIEPTHLFASTAQPFIFVTVQYRLGQFGFLSGSQVGKDGAYNVGMLDQRAGLRWVQQYIKYFGGDSKRVTIWGSSAGAGSTMFHLIANEGENEGLFNQAMGCSPSMSYMPEAGSAYDQSVFNDIASKVQCDSKDPNVLACLRKAPVKALANAGNSVAVARKPTVFVFAPRLESRGKFLSNRAVEAFKDGKFAQVSVLFGSNTNEGAGWADYGNDATEAKVYDFLRGQYAPFTNESFSKALDLYPVKDFKNPSGQGQQMYGEARYVCSANLITGNAKRLGLASYHYHYNNAHLGSNHGSENGAFFGPPATANAEDTALFEDMRKFWTSFVTSGNPVVGDENGLKWEAVSLDTAGPRMRLDPQAGNMEPMDDALNARCNFWHGISKELET